jgi:hypothetical protein
LCETNRSGRSVRIIRRILTAPRLTLESDMSIMETTTIMKSSTFQVSIEI